MVVGRNVVSNKVLRSPSFDLFSVDPAVCVAKGLPLLFAAVGTVKLAASHSVAPEPQCYACASLFFLARLCAVALGA